jgi:hypothetical protein
MGRSSEDVERQARIVRYWRAVEYFSPPKVDPVDPKNEIRSVVAGRALPWQPDVLDPPRKNCVWRHTVYAGIFDVGKVREVLQNALHVPENELDFDSNIRGDSALLSFAIDEDGHLLKDSVTLSVCGWAVSRTLAPGPDSDTWLSGFALDQLRLLGYLFEIGDGRIPIEPAAGGKSGDGRALGLVAGTAARVALDVVTGGISALPAVISALAAPAVGSIAATVIEKVGEALADDVNESIKAKVDGDQSDDDGDDDNTEDDAENPPSRLGVKVLTVDDLAAITRWVAETLGVAEALQPDTIRVKSYQIPLRSADDVSTDDFLNSFYADDLERVADEVAGGNSSGPLTEFLRASESIDMTRRIDLRESPNTVLRSVEPISSPLGRWPAEPDRPLTLSQQFSINRICAELGDPAARGVYAVNGPPGTGKTTMLRDLIAALVVERATRLAKLRTARDAFERTTVRWRTTDGGKSYGRTINPLRSDLTGFEIVVASSNNGAVENITLEVPAAKTVDLETFPGADYLAGPATVLTGTPCWGAIAARLGRRDYRHAFVDRFWWGNADRGNSANREDTTDLPGLHKYLKGIVADDAEVLSWRDAVAKFDAAVAQVRRLAGERQVITGLFAREGRPDAALTALRTKAATRRGSVTRLGVHQDDLERQATRASEARSRADADVTQAQAALTSAQAKIDRAHIHVGVANAALKAHDADKPGLLRRLVFWHAMRDWREAAKPLLDELREADRMLRDAEAHYGNCDNLHTARQQDLNAAIQAERQCCDLLSRCRDDLKTAVTALAVADDAVVAREAVLRQEAETLAEARRRWPHTVPGDEWRPEAADRDAMEQREKSAPWMDEEFATARSRVFLAALDLHRAVLTAEPDLMWTNLRAVMDVVSGTAPSDLPEKTVLAAWQMLFFVVPVVSTTFASMSRMFAKLGREALGWLFVDEAGQAVPQAAVGALWRTRRAVIVGDPRQLEPVITLPWSGQKRLCGQFDVDPQWAPQNSSVQSIADRLNPFGTRLPEPDGSGSTWVGSPLRVHRRCDRLMFEVSNRIAYDGMMVYGVLPRPDFDVFATNTWLDVGALPSGAKWNPVEGQYVLATLAMVRRRIAARMSAELADTTPTWAENARTQEAELARRVSEAVFIVSPFREVVENLREVAGNRLLPRSNRLGTIHTTQGKEADVVILVLGTATDQAGSRAWASRRPNLLNVAVTRARRRLVVVGDYRNWSRQRNFSVLARYGASDPGSLLRVVDAVTEWPLQRSADEQAHHDRDHDIDQRRNPDQ